MGVAVFLFGDGPFWAHVWDLTRVDRAIWYSYAIIPVLVLAVLAWRRRLTWITFLFGTVETTAYKFGITFVIAHGAWVFADPAPHPVFAPKRVEIVRKAPLLPSRIDPAMTGEIRGVARPGALVYVESGLEHLVFAPDDRTPIIEHDGEGFTPFTVVQVGQSVDVISRDGRIHTLRAIDARHIIRRNHAVIPSERTALVPFDKPYGMLELDCTVHRGTERPSHLLVLGHPFFARADDQGAFRFTGVPAGKLRIAALDEKMQRVVRSVDLKPGSIAEVDL